MARIRLSGLSQRQACQILSIARSRLFYVKQPTSGDQVQIMNSLSEIYAQFPFMGYRRLTLMLRSAGYRINAKRTLRLMRLMGLQALHPRKNLSKRRLKDLTYPHLLSQQPARAPNDVWQVDITYLRLQKGFVYLTALLDVISRRVMGWHLSPYLETQSCLHALEMALSHQVKPCIVNSDQGCQFTSMAWTSKLTEHSIQISMTGKGRCLDNIYIERFWRPIKYEEVYLKTYETVKEAPQAIKRYVEFYNTQRPHQSLGYQTPQDVYTTFTKEKDHDLDDQEFIEIKFPLFHKPTK